MSFLVRSQGSRRWSQASGLAGVRSLVSFRRRDGGSAGGAGSGGLGVDDGASAAGYLLAEVREARAAVAALDRYLFKARSFKDASFELVEQAHLAMSRLEQAVAVRAAPELILLACEVKVAARRGVELLRTYGRYTFFGKLAAWVRRGRVEAKFDAVTERLRGLMLQAPASQMAGPGDGTAPPGAAPTSPFMRQANGGGSGGGAGSGSGGGPRGSDAGLASASDTGIAGASAGQLLRRGRHERVYSVSFVPPAVAAASGGLCVWWALESSVEFYSDATQATTSFAIEGDVFLTSVAIDGAGNTWGGTNGGTILARRPCVWDSQAEERLFSGAVRAIAFDVDAATVWAGDEHGCLRSARLNDSSWRIEPLVTALAGRAPRRGISMGTLLSVSGRRTLRRTVSNERSSSGPPVFEGPIRCILARDDRVWVAGGRSEPWMALMHARTGALLDFWRCGINAACNSMLALTWPAPTRRTTSSLLAEGRSASSAGGSLPASVPEDHAPEDPRASWQLLTGHDNGQVLVWNAAADHLQPACKLGEVGSAVRTVASLDSWGLVATAHANGEIVLFARPGGAGDWGGGSISGAASHALGSGTGSGSGSGSGSGACTAPSFGAPAGVGIGVACVRPRRIVLRAHRSSVVAAGGCPSGLITASSQGTLRLWRAADLAREADRAGLLIGVGRRTTASVLSADSNRLPAFISRQTTNSGDGAEAPTRAASGAVGAPGSSAAAAVAAAPTTARAGSAAPAAAALAADTRPAAGASGSSPDVTAAAAAVLPSAALTAQGRTVSAAAEAPDTLPSRPGEDGWDSVPSHSRSTVSAPLPTITVPDPGALHLSSFGGQMPGTASPFAGGGGVPWRQGGAATSAGSGPPGTIAVTSYGSGPVMAPRKPRALRQVDALQQAESRERRKSERRLSKGAQIAWSTCQIIESRELKLQSSIGSGAYGKVWLAEWMGTQVAAKELLCLTSRVKDDVSRKRRERTAGAGDRPDGGAADSGTDSGNESEDSVDAEVGAELKELMNEVYLLGSLSHPNIMRFCAVCLDPPMIVTQYYQHGSLFDLLKRARRGDRRARAELTWSKRLDMLRDVAAGMVFLHSRRPPVVHGDLRSPNLLLDMAFDRDKPRLHVKIADFGLACMMGPAKTLAVSKVTNPRWSAPEVIRDSSVSTSADVFSFAVVMWELLTWQQPYEDMMSVQVLFSVMQSLRPDMPDDTDLPGRPGPSLPAYKALMESCWTQDADARPSFEAIVAAIDDMRAADRAARAAEQGLSGGGEAAAGSRRTSYSGGDSTLSSPVASHVNFAVGFAAGRPQTDDVGAGPSARGAADSATSIDAPTGAAAAAAALLATQGGGWPGAAGGERGGACAVSDDGGVSPAAASGQSSPGPFGASEPSFAFFAGGGAAGAAGGGPPAGALPSGGPSGSGFGFAGPTGPDSTTPPAQYATADALRGPHRNPSRLGRGSASGAGASTVPDLPPIVRTASPTAAGLSPSPGAPLARPSSPFAMVQLPDDQGGQPAEQQQQQQQQQQPVVGSSPQRSPFASACAVVPEEQEQRSPAAPASPPRSPFAAAMEQGWPSGEALQQQQQQQRSDEEGHHQGQQQMEQQRPQQRGRRRQQASGSAAGASSSSPTARGPGFSPFAAAAAGQAAPPSPSAASGSPFSPFAAAAAAGLVEELWGSPDKPRGLVASGVPEAAAAQVATEAKGGGSPAAGDAECVGSFVWMADAPAVARLRQEQQPAAAAGHLEQKHISGSLTFPFAGGPHS